MIQPSTHPATEPLNSTEQATLVSSSFRRDYFGDLYLFDWTQFAWRLPLICIFAIAISLGIGLAAGHPGAGLIAAGGAMTVGFGTMQSIDGSRFIPMIGAAVGMAFSTLIGMVVGHESYVLLVTAAIWGFAYGLLTTRAAGVSWVGQQCLITLLVASAFPFHLRDAAVRALLMLAGGLLQVVCVSIQLRVVRSLRLDVLRFYAALHHRAVCAARQHGASLSPTAWQGCTSEPGCFILDCGLPSYSLRVARSIDAGRSPVATGFL